MRILHYTIGFKPLRSGGLVNYSTDLINEEAQSNFNTVFALIPSTKSMFSREPKITRTTSKAVNRKVQVYQIIGSLPLALKGGIQNPMDFMEKVDIHVYTDFFKRVKPDVIHVHSLMGIHREFFLAANQLNIPIVYTTHDYYGLAPEPNMFFNNESYDRNNSPFMWQKVSLTAMSTKRLRLFQSRCYPLIRTIINTATPLKQYLRIRNNSRNPIENVHSISEFKLLRDYYTQIFSLVTLFHFNSIVAKQVYKQNLPFEVSGQVVAITDHSIPEGVQNFKKLRLNSGTRIAYIGPNSSFKGYNEFIRMTKSVNNRKFVTFGYLPTRKIQNVFQGGRYEIEDLDNIYNCIDLMIVPSVWKETFGLVVLEALSRHTRVVVRDNVGSSDLIPQAYRFKDFDELVSIVESEELPSFSLHIKSMRTHTEEIFHLYRLARSERNPKNEENE